MKGEPESMSGKKMTPLYERIRQILESARTRMARTVNTTQVAANWLIGCEIVEEEQEGQRRAEYSEQRSESIANIKSTRRRISHAVRSKSEEAEKVHAMPGKLDTSYITDASVRKLTLLSVPSVLEIGHTVCGKSWQPFRLHPNLQWAPYRTYLRVDKLEPRNCYGNITNNRLGRIKCKAEAPS